MKRLRRNVALNLGEVLINALVLFVLYRVIVARLGVSALGIWSLVSSTTAVGRAFDLGAAGGLARYVAISTTDSGSSRTIALVDSAVLLNIVLYLAVALALFVPARLSLGGITTGEATRQIYELLPYALAAFGISSVGNVVASALIGFGRSDIKSAAGIVSASAQLGTAAYLAPRYGLVGVGIAQVVMYSIQLIIGWFMVNRQIYGHFVLRLPVSPSRPALRELLRFGVRLQAINLVGFIHDPAVRYVFAAAGGVGMLGYYEMASRCVTQIRAILSAPTQNLVPMFASVQSRGGLEFERIYDVAVVTLSVCSTLALGLFAAASPLVSELWIGRVSPEFVSFAWICALGWLVNLVGIPAYFIGIGLNYLRWNIAGVLLTTVTSPALAWAAGRALGDRGLVAGAMVGVALGAMLTLHMNTRTAGLAAFPAPGRAAAVLATTIRSALRGVGSAKQP